MSLSRSPRLNARREQRAHKPTDPTTIAVYALVFAGLVVMTAAVWLDLIKVATR